MSRFFAVNSDSESESSSSEEDVPQPRTVSAKQPTFQFSDDEEDVKRVVRSAKDKRYEELQGIIKTMKNHKKIKDMSKLLTDFEDLGKAYDKSKKVVEKEGNPRFYIRCLVELEDFVSECWEDRDGRKAMSKNNAKGLTTLRQKLKRYLRDFEEEVTKYRENPDVGQEEEDSNAEQGDSDDDEEAISGPDMFKKTAPVEKSKFAAGGEGSDGEDSEDSDYWKMSESSSSSSEDEGAYEGGLTAAMFLRKDRGGEKDEEKKREKKKRTVKKVKMEEDDEDGEWEKVKAGASIAMEKPKMFSKDAEINHDAVLKKLIEILAARGKKATDRSEQMDMLAELRSIADANNLGAAMDVKILFNICAAIYDYNPNIATCMKGDMWEMCMSHVRELLDKLVANPDIICGENVAEDSESFEGTPPLRIRGCMLTMVERMDEEFIKMLQACDAHSTEYVERLKDEPAVCKLIEDLKQYLEGRATTEEICRVYMKQIEHEYYKKQQDNSSVQESLKLMDHLCKYIYAKDNTDLIRTRALLCHIYHLALHDHWFEARDLMLMSHLQDTIQHSDIPTQIRYNRAMVQLGLCAFRQGMIRDAHNCLVDIQSGGRAKELLAQGLLLQRQHERTPEQEKIEKRRQMPYHMHINLELLECTYLVSAMLLEIPYMAAHEFDARRRMISKNFHHVMRVSERQPLVGPPESMREHLVAASKAMKQGNWEVCKNYIINEKMNAKVWDLFHETDKVRNMIMQKIKEESLRTYLFTYSHVYDTLCLQTLADMFNLERDVVHSIISKMIINEELMASLDEPSASVMMHRTEPTRLQSLALQLSEKVSSLVETNERMMEMKQGTFFYQNKNPGNRQDNRYNRDRDNQGYQGGRRDRRDRGDRGDRDRDRDRR